MRLVVCSDDTHADYPAKRCEEGIPGAEEGAEEGEPGSDAAVGGASWFIIIARCWERNYRVEIV